MKEGDIVLTLLPQADGKSKLRPALAFRFMPPFKDFLVCGISSQLHQRVKDFDEIIDINDADFKQCGLLQSSLVRLGFLAVLPAKSIAGNIGSISPMRHERLLKNLSEYLSKKT
jgi:mRNA interferase MazF